MSQFRNIIVRLSRDDDYLNTYDLTFDIIDSSFTTKWIDRVLHAQQRQDSISEPGAFYNLNNEWSEQRILDEINKKILFCNQYEKMFDRSLSSINDQDTLNYIHSVFELRHGKIDEWKNDPIISAFPELRKELSEINQLVHRAETVDILPRLRIVYFDLPKTNTFTENDYKLFTNSVDFGGLYTLYADVGKNLESLARDNDDYHHDFVPNIHYSADFSIHFHDTDGIKETQLYDEYLAKNWDYFEFMGYSLDDPRLTTGRIKLAQLRYNSRREILDNLSKYNNIQSVMLI